MEIIYPSTLSSRQ